VHLIGVAPDSHTKSPQELIRESNFAITPNVDSFFLDPRISDQIYKISLFSSIANRWKQILCTVGVDLVVDS
jgi:hypothetical protein